MNKKIRIILTESIKASVKDMEDAIQHADTYGDQGWTINDFKIINLGEISLERIADYDDFSSWVDIDPEEFSGLSTDERLALLADFRGQEWANRAATWLKTGVPPIVVIEAPVVSENELYQQIGDGRGRVNFAFAMGLETLPVVLMKWKHKLPKNKGTL